MSDGPSGVRGQRFAGGPPSVSFPCGAALGATWDVELVARVGAALAEEARAKGAHVLLGPTVNLQRTPLGGRHFECFSEDPVLTAELAVAYVEGLQGAGVAACVKHLVANDQEHDRFEVSSEPDERTLREVSLLPVRARAAARRRLVDDGGLQPAARHPLLAARAAAHHDPPRRVGLGRRGDLRLVRGARHRRAGARRPRPRDARPAAALGRRAGRAPSTRARCPSR